MVNNINTILGDEGKLIELMTLTYHRGKSIELKY